MPDDIRDEAAMTPFPLVIYRFFIGVFVDADYPIATSLITEFTPKHHRAISMGMVSAAWYLGATVAAVVGFALRDVDGGWRLMLGSAIVPCVFLLIGRCKVPESPLWLKSKGRHEEARRVVFRVYGADVILEDKGEEPKHKAGFAEVFSKGYAARIVFFGNPHVVPGRSHVRYLHVRPADHVRLRPGRREERDLGRERLEPVLPGGVPACHVLAEFHGKAAASHPVAVPHGRGPVGARAVPHRAPPAMGGALLFVGRLPYSSEMMRFVRAETSAFTCSRSIPGHSPSR